jgi:hypothetical protein
MGVLEHYRLRLSTPDNGASHPRSNDLEVERIFGLSLVAPINAHKPDTIFSEMFSIGIEVVSLTA